MQAPHVHPGKRGLHPCRETSADPEMATHAADVRAVPEQALGYLGVGAMALLGEAAQFADRGVGPGAAAAHSNSSGLPPTLML